MLPAFVAVAIRSLVRLGLAHDAVNASACRAAARNQSNRRGKSLNCEQAKWRAALAATALTVALTLRTAQVRRPAGVGADSAHTGDNRASCAERWRQRQTPSGSGRAAFARCDFGQRRCIRGGSVDTERPSQMQGRQRFERNDPAVLQMSAALFTISEVADRLTSGPEGSQNGESPRSPRFRHAQT
jgi:hypothetical protein